MVDLTLTLLKLFDGPIGCHSKLIEEVMMMRLIIAGSRDFRDKAKLFRIVDMYLMEFGEVTIISGGARGADRLGERYSKARGLGNPDVFMADWDNLGKPAGNIRNGEMAISADRAIVFMKNNSSGSKDMINKMRKLKKPVQVVYCNSREVSHG